MDKLIKLFLKISGLNFFKDADKVDIVQEKLLFKYIKENKDTIFGIKYNFKDIKTLKDFQKNVPITTYEDYEEYIEKIFDGHKNVLTKDDVKVLEQTSGSSGKKKYIPYTSTLQNEYNAGIFPWLYDLSVHYKDLFDGCMYWSITPATDESKDEKNVKVGFEDDAEYLGPVGKIARKWFVVPKLIARIADLEKFQIVTCIFLFSREDLRFISVWNASFLTNLFEAFEKNKAIIIDSIIQGKILVDIDLNIKTKLEKILKKPNKKQLNRLNHIKENNLSYKEIFPKLELVSAWGDSNAIMMYDELVNKLGDIYVQKKGVLATEGVISIPIEELADGHAVTYKSHFYEFIDIENGNICLLKDLEKDREYSILMTTGGGFYRYKLGDIVRVIDFYKSLPVIKFICRENVSDYCGEKLNEDFVTKILKSLIEKHKLEPLYTLFAPICENGKYSYRLYIELENDTSLEVLQSDFENELLNNYHYNYCRQIGQLLDFKVVKIKDGNKKYLERCTNEFGQKLGNIKNIIFSKNLGWEKYFS